MPTSDVKVNKDEHTDGATDHYDHDDYREQVEIETAILKIAAVPRLPVSRMVGETGFEPATLCSQSRCATRLRHSPMIRT